MKTPFPSTKNDPTLFMEVPIEKDPRYPMTVQYCGVCGLPPEYCEYGPNFSKCKIWIAEFCPELLQGSPIDNNEDVAKEEQEKVKLLPGGKVKKTEPPTIVISRSSRTKRKWITTIVGLAAFNIKLDDACKVIRAKFACGASPATKNKDEITIQGDIMYDVYELLMINFKGKIKQGDVFYLEEDGSKVVATLDEKT